MGWFKDLMVSTIISASPEDTKKERLSKIRQLKKDADETEAQFNKKMETSIPGSEKWQKGGITPEELSALEIMPKGAIQQKLRQWLDYRNKNTK